MTHLVSPDTQRRALQDAMSHLRHGRLDDAESGFAGLLRRLGRRDEADQAAQHAVSVAPNDAHAWFTLARVQVEPGRMHAGLKAHARGVALAPRDIVGREQVLRSLALLGHRDEAAALWRDCLQECPDDPIALHHEAACVGRPPQRASDAYVKTVFDGFASTFDAKMAKLQYRAPELVVATLDELNDSDSEWGMVADIGCGTGLVGGPPVDGLLVSGRPPRLRGDRAHPPVAWSRHRSRPSRHVGSIAWPLCRFGGSIVIAAARLEVGRDCGDCGEVHDVSHG